MITDDQLARIQAIITTATATGNTQRAARANDLLRQALAQNARETAGSDRIRPAGADPITRAREPRGPVPPRNLRKGRTRCSATRRDGLPCSAPAVEGADVCRVHGGSAPQVVIASGVRIRQDRLLAALDVWHSRRDLDSLGKVNAAWRELDAYEARLARLRELRRQHRRALRAISG